MAFPLREIRSLPDGMDEDPEGIALILGYKDHEGFSHEPRHGRIQKGSRSGVRLVNMSPLIRHDQGGQRSFKTPQRIGGALSAPLPRR